MSDRIGPVVVFRLMHFKIGKLDRGDPEDDRVAQHRGIGVYRSAAAAAAGAGRLRRLPGFRKWPEGFRIYPLVLDQIGWPDGFTEAEADQSYWEWPQEEIVPE